MDAVKCTIVIAGLNEREPRAKSWPRGPLNA